MAFWNRRKPEAPAATARFGTVVVPAEMTEGGLNWLNAVSPISRSDALSVPAVLRARNLICATLGGLPMRVHAPDKTVKPNRLLDQPERGVPRSVTMTMTYEDLLFEGEAWWRITAFGWDNFPTEVRRVHPSRVSVQENGRVYIDGTYVPDGELIRFDSPMPGLLTAAARAIRTSLKLDSAAARYADEPIPPGYFTPTGEDPEADQVVNVLDNWKRARNERGTAYVPGGLSYNTVALTPEQMQLADSRQHAVLEIARACGIDAEDLGVSTTSRTYFNAEDRRQAFIDFTLGPFVSAVQDRLSMPDVTPRGSAVKVVFEGFLRGDVMTRYQSYALGLQVGAIAPDEIRDLEDKPALSPSQRPAAPAPAVSPVPQQASITNGAPVAHTFSRESGITFEAVPDAQFKVDAHARTVTGLVVPYGPVASNGGARWRFQKGSLKFADLKRVKLLRDHDASQALGVAIKATDTDQGMVATFKVARGTDGDNVLALAEDGVLDGFSVGVDFTDGGWNIDPTDESVRLVTAAAWRETSLTAMPAFDSARVSSVTASSSERDLTMTEAVEQAAPAAETAAFTSAVEAFTEAVKGLTVPQREVVPAGDRAVGFTVTEKPVYTFEPGKGNFSLVRDTFKARVEDDREAADRLRKFNAQIAEFATVNRTVGANVIPPGYKADLYQPQLFQERPLMAMVSRGTLTDATPFTLPTFTSATGATADHVEGTNPTDGTLVIGTRTVTPGAISGLFKVTREVVDAANPAIDAIALAAMRESYSQQTEGKVYTELNGANGVGGVITSGFVPSGAAAVTATGVGATGAAGAALLDTLRDQIVAYPFRRFASPNRLALSAEAAQQFAKAKDGQSRPLLPRIGAMNSTGTVSVLDQAFDIDGLAGVPAWSMTGNAAGDADTILWNSQDVWAWESPTLTFRYEERSGPALIELALFGYFAVRILRPAGFSGIRLTVT